MRLRFTIRDLLWLAVVSALAVAWWVDHRRQVALAAFSIEPLDVLKIESGPITGSFLVEPGGMVNLGLQYGKVSVRGLSLKEAESAVLKQFRRKSITAAVSVTLAERR